MDRFEVGELFIYQNGDRYEIGKVKEVLTDNMYWCFYHSGETASLTSGDLMHELINNHCILGTSLGGEVSK